MFIVELTFKASLDVVGSYAQAHSEFLDQYYDSGNFIVSGPQNPKTGGIIVVNAENKAAVEKIIKEDPFVIHDVVDYQIIEFEANKKQSWFQA